MTEPKNVAMNLEEIVPGVFHWHVLDDRIESESDSFAVVEKGAAVLIDPLPIDEKLLGRLGKVEAIVLSAACHQRSAWRLRKRTGAKVHAPAGAENLEEKPDASYSPGDRLPGGLQALHAPGPTEAHYAFLLDRGPGIVFCADLLMNVPGKGLTFIPGEYQDDPARTRESVKKLLDHKFEILCPDHGAPVKREARRAVAELMQRESDRA
jgi:glyoxylase-like metal-dependent hydrolase (beta-lactamase superfamily II)